MTSYLFTSSLPPSSLSPPSFPSPRSLDMSFNRVRVVEGLSPLVNLRELYLIQNKITQLQGLECLTSLTMLELGSNRIRVGGWWAGHDGWRPSVAQ